MIRCLLRALLRCLCRVRLEGDASVLASPRLLVVANHESFLDGLLLGLFLPVRPVFVVHTTVLGNWFFRLCLSQVEWLAVDPANPMGMKTVVRLIESGRPVMIFPEGRLTTTGSLMKVYEGPAFVAARAGAAVVPVRLDGPARTFFSRLSGPAPRRLFPRITLTVLPPTAIPMPDGGSAKARRRQAGESMRRVMQHMLFASEPRQTLGEALLRAVDRFGPRMKILEDVRFKEQSYRDVLKTALALGRLLERGTSAGERVGVLMPNTGTTVGLVFGLSAFGRVPAMLNYTAGADGVRGALATAGIRTVVTSREFIAKGRLDGLLDGLAGARTVFLEDLRPSFTLRDKIWLAGWALPFPRRVIRAGDPDAEAVVLFTSGSEGKPKGVVHSHRSLLANVAQMKAVIDFSPDDKCLVALPLFHAFGLTCGMILPLVAGARLFLYPSPLHYRVIPELAYDRSCTVLFGTNSFLAQYARAAHPYDFYHRMRHVVAGAERLTEAVRDVWFEKFGLRVLEGYGATECAPVVAVNTPMACRFGTVGELLPGIEHRLTPVPGIERGGLLHVRGPNLMKGYLLHDRPGELSPPSSDAGDGWYATGDIVEIDTDGFVKILCRVKRFAKVAGEMVSLETVEQLALAAVPDGLHAAVSRPDAQKGEQIVLCTTAAGLKREHLVAAGRARGMPELAVPRRIVVLPALPLLGTGKVDYVALKRLVEQDAGV